MPRTGSPGTFQENGSVGEGSDRGERVHCHSVIIKKIDFKSRMQRGRERWGRRGETGKNRCGLNEW